MGPPRSSTREKKQKDESNQGDASNNDSTDTKKRVPLFRLPPEYSQDPDRFEFWTVRVPMSVNLTDIQGCRIHNNTNNNNSSSAAVAGLSNAAAFPDDNFLFTASSGGDSVPSSRKFALHFGHGAENETLRLIVPRQQINNNDDDDSDDSDNENAESDVLVPLPKGFTRHVNVLEHHEARTEQQLAPHKDDAPTEGSELRRAYTSLPQKTGLKRRWQPAGSSAMRCDADDPILSVVESNKTKNAESEDVVVADQQVSVAEENGQNSKSTDEGRHENGRTDAKRKRQDGLVTNGNLNNERQAPAEVGRQIESHVERNEEDDDKDSVRKSKKARKEAKKARKEAKKAKKEKKKKDSKDNSS
ncbi:hypothetical protein ACA910_000771 [Epithemia clementina (nom. ined.)]